MTDERALDAGIEELLAFLLEKRGLDFTGYKRASLSRRVQRRLDAVGIDDIGAYRDLLEADPAEQIHLTNTILINVTEFYRDQPAWVYLLDRVIPAIVERKASDEPIRVWSAGCASGQEAYTVAMLFADHLGIEQFKDRVKVFATDVDDDALAEARAGVYTARQLEAVPSEQRERYFEPANGDFVFRSDCRRSVIFGHHDITSDAPISRLDLLICRNVLMYFVAETQHRVLQRFRYALGEQGLLFLGKAETVFAHSDLFAPVEASLRVFEPAGHVVRPLAPPLRTHEHTALSVDRLQALAVQRAPVAQLVIDVAGRLVSANDRARSMFAIDDDDIGRRFAELPVAHQPIELQPHIQDAYNTVEPVVIHDVMLDGPGDRNRYLEIALVRLDVDPEPAAGVSVTFADVSELGRTRADLEQSATDLRMSNDELTSLNLQLEHSNEELQSANEELETTNEELQSANEELETMNEELRSANEELETMNDELLHQAREIERAERFLAATLDSLVGGVAVLSHQFDVIVWNRAAEDLFGLRADDVAGRSFLALDIGLPVGEVGPLLHALSSSDGSDESPSDHQGSLEVILDAFDRRGRPIRCRVTVRRFARSPEPDAQLVVFFDVLAEVPT